MRMRMSMSRCFTTWCATSGWPKVWRVRAQSSASSRHTCAKAQAPALISSRSPLKLAMIVRKPAFSGPMRWSAGTRTPAKRRWAVSLHHQPILASSLR